MFELNYAITLFNHGQIDAAAQHFREFKALWEEQEDDVKNSDADVLEQMAELQKLLGDKANTNASHPTHTAAAAGGAGAGAAAPTASAPSNSAPPPQNAGSSASPQNGAVPPPALAGGR